MKRRHSHIAGNGLMGLGLLMMIAGVAYAVVNQMPQFSSSEFIVQGAIFSIFLGALLWLVGARVSGREKITDRYYWVRHCGDKRCRHGASTSQHRPH